MKKHSKGILICAVVAAALEAGLLFAAHQPSNGPNIFTLCVVPFFAFASAFHGSLADVVFYTSMFLFFFVITLLPYLLWMLITKDNHDA
jgi:uncharacterized membrane protein YcfT